MDRVWSRQWLRGWALTRRELVIAMCVLVGLVVAFIVAGMCTSGNPGRPTESDQARTARTTARQGSPGGQSAKGPAQSSGVRQR